MWNCEKSQHRTDLLKIHKTPDRERDSKHQNFGRESYALNIRSIHGRCKSWQSITAKLTAKYQHLDNENRGNREREREKQKDKPVITLTRVCEMVLRTYVGNKGYCRTSQRVTQISAIQVETSEWERDKQKMRITTRFKELTSFCVSE